MRLVALSLLAILSQATAARAQYGFESWTADAGLPQNIITGIQQTRDGFLWIATLDGLARFDGVRFTVFNKASTPGILTNRFTTLYADRQGELWLGSEGGSVTRYTPQRVRDLHVGARPAGERPLGIHGRRGRAICGCCRAKRFSAGIRRASGSSTWTDRRCRGATAS